MTNCYVIRPIDTLFFRGAEPMNRGEQHVTSSHFPPQISTLEGAVRTTYLLQKNISFKDYNRGKVDKEIIDEIGEPYRPPHFSIWGPLFYKNNNFYIPAPYSWYTDAAEIKRIEETQKKSVKITVRKGILLEKTEDLLFSDSPLLWVKNPKAEMKSLGGYWIKISDISKKEGEEFEVFSLSCFVTSEPHTGIALTKSGIVNEGHLYTFNHTRLDEGVQLCFGIEPEISLEPEGIMKIGAEQRFSLYQRLTKIKIPVGESSNQYLALSRVAGTKKANSSVIASGKIQYIGGYDLAKGFHKPMVGYFPAGSVFKSKEVTPNCIEL